jgi:hypothetical protein
MEDVIESFKRTVSRDFQFLFFLRISFPQALSIPLGPFQIFSEIRGDIRSLRCNTGDVDTGGKWKKSSVIKSLNHFILTPLGSRVSL